MAERLRLATAPHPYSPASWLDKEAAEKYLWQARGFPMRLTLTWCRKQGIEVSSTGHIRLLSLAHYVARFQAEEAQREADLGGLRDSASLEEAGTHSPNCRCSWCLAEEY